MLRLRAACQHQHDHGPIRLPLGFPLVDRRAFACYLPPTMSKRPSKQETFTQTIGVFMPTDEQLRPFIQQTRAKFNLPPDGDRTSQLSPTNPTWHAVSLTTRCGPL